MVIVLNMNVDWIVLIRMKKENISEIFVNVRHSLEFFCKDTRYFFIHQIFLIFFAKNCTF